MTAVQFIISSAFSIIPPVIPLLLPAMGVHEPGAVRLWAGALLGVTPLSAALMSPWWGRLSDRIDRRLIILISCAAVALCTALMSLVSHPTPLLALRFGMGLFGGHVAAGMALISAVTPVSRLGYALGWMATAQLAGSLLGPVIGGGLADTFGNLRAPFFGASVATVLVAGAIALVPSQARSSGTRPAVASAEVPVARPKHGELAPLIVVLLLVQCAIMSPQPIVSLRVLELEGPRRELATLAGFAFSVVALAGLIGAPVLGRLADQMGARQVLLWSALAAALCTVPQAFAPDYVWFVAERFLGGLFLAGIIPTVNALIGKSVAEADRGRTYGITASAAFLGAFLGPVGGGALAAQFGLPSVFLGSGFLLLAAAVWIAARVTPSSSSNR
jgi:DHA1 family multidrug resistance protein-like MFS transporter